MSALPPCGIYRTRRALGGVPAGSLVYFHNHGEPGPGIYLPERWRHNRAVWQRNGTTVPDAAWYETGLEPLAPEGFYRVRETFTCCEKNCRQFEADLLVQLGYDAQANAILFVPELIEGGLAIAETGTRIDDVRVARLEQLKVAEHRPPEGPVQ